MDFKIAISPHCFKMWPNQSTMLWPMYCQNEYMFDPRCSVCIAYVLSDWIYEGCVFNPPLMHLVEIFLLINFWKKSHVCENNRISCYIGSSIFLGRVNASYICCEGIYDSVLYSSYRKCSCRGLSVYVENVEKIGWAESMCEELEFVVISYWIIRFLMPLF